MIDTTTGRIQTKGIQHNSNVITDVSGPHGRVAPTLKKYPEIVFEEGKFDRNDTTNTYVQAGYTVTASTTYSTHRTFKAFNGVPNDFFHWQVGSFSNSDGTYSGGTQSFESIPGEWLKIEVPNKIKPASINLYRRDFDGQSPKDFKIYASITGNSWTLLTEQTGIDNWTNAAKSYNFDTGIYYKYFAILVTKITRTNSAGAQTSGTLGELEIYGYEEYTPAGDHSVDTTIMSRFNNPQLTGVQVLVDGATDVGTNQISGGPDPSGNQSTYVTDGKYWTLNGTLTSNLSVEANTFLEGDQPHAVSVWFNSSNLEANVSNTCVFSISDQEHLNSENLDLQSNTWHNLTYAYQGEGGSRVTYLDGRKVAEDQAEDTFGNYPPFEMTGYSQGGYVASASSNYSTGTPGAELRDFGAFNPAGTGYGQAWLSGTGNYSSVDGTYTASPQKQHHAGSAYGEWLQIEMPRRIQVNYFILQGRPESANSYQGLYSCFKNAEIWGSVDGTNWNSVVSGTAFGTFTPSTLTQQHTITVNSSNSYKYFAIIVTNTNTQNSAAGLTYAGIGRWQIYGHHENDLVRLPDPTNVLKYPHIAMTGPAQRGYVVTSSSNQNSATHPPWEAFDESVATNTSGWIWPTSGTHNLGTESGSGIATDGGHWIRLELPHKLVVNRVDVISDAQNPQGRDEFPDEYAIYGWNGSGTWTKLLDVTGKNPTLGTSTTFSDTISNSTAYKHIALVVKSYYNNSSSYGRIAEIKYYGTGVDSVPIQIGVGTSTRWPTLGSTTSLLTKTKPSRFGMPKRTRSAGRNPR